LNSLAAHPADRRRFRRPKGADAGGVEPIECGIEHEEGDDVADKRLSQSERKAVFLALVQAQDGGMDAAKSREDVAGRFSLSQEQVKKIEKEGIEAEWPPLT